MPFDGPEVSSSFQKRPAYRYLRRSDHLPRYDQIPDISFDRIDAKVKLFNPTGIGTWYVAAYDPEDHIAWGVVDLHEIEVGSFSMDELVDFRGRFGLPIERDLHWSPKSLATLQAAGGRYRVAEARGAGAPQRLSLPRMEADRAVLLRRAEATNRFQREHPEHLNEARTAGEIGTFRRLTRRSGRPRYRRR